MGKEINKQVPNPPSSARSLRPTERHIKEVLTYALDRALHQRDVHRLSGGAGGRLGAKKALKTQRASGVSTTGPIRPRPAVDYGHRCIRCGRVGKTGRVTFYTNVTLINVTLFIALSKRF